MKDRTVRLYGKAINAWRVRDEQDRLILRQLEIEYTDYYTDTGEVAGVGSEDFSADRWNNSIVSKAWWIWDGQKRNAGGHRWFDYVGFVTYQKGKGKLVKKLLKKIGADDVAEIQLR